MVNIIPVVQIRPRCLLIYDRIEGLPRRTKEEYTHMTEAMFYKGTYNGLLSPGSLKRLKRAIELLIAISTPKEAIHFKSKKTFKFRVNFVTFTLPAPQGNITDKELKSKCLDPWLKMAKRKFGLKNYVWRAERQKNGNLHFHLMSDCYILYSSLRDTWNHQLSKFHFIDSFYQKHGHYKPNSTDVHAVKNIRDLAAYVSKYMAKKEKTPDRIDGTVWDCSRNLKRKDFAELVIDNAISAMLNRAINDFKLVLKEADQCSLISYSEFQRDEILCPEAKSAYENWIQSIKN